MSSPLPDVKVLPSIDVMLTLLTIYIICVCLRIVVSNIFCVAYLFSYLRLVYPMLPVSVDCPFLIGPSVFSQIALQYVQYLYIKLTGTICITLLKLFFRRNDQIAYIVYTDYISAWQYISKIILEITRFS